jgi:hypothetical protein
MVSTWCVSARSWRSITYDVIAAVAVKARIIFLFHYLKKQVFGYNKVQRVKQDLKVGGGGVLTYWASWTLHLAVF